jgi:hypothetical protein
MEDDEIEEQIKVPQNAIPMPPPEPEQHIEHSVSLNIKTNYVPKRIL